MCRVLFAAVVASLLAAAPAASSEGPSLTSVAASAAAAVRAFAEADNGSLTDKQMIEGAMVAVRQQMRLHPAVEFRAVRVVSHPSGGRVVCGEVFGVPTFGGVPASVPFVSTARNAWLASAAGDARVVDAINSGMRDVCVAD